jgi:hypothetical protein
MGGPGFHFAFNQRSIRVISKLDNQLCTVRDATLRSSLIIWAMGILRLYENAINVEHVLRKEERCTTKTTYQQTIHVNNVMKKEKKHTFRNPNQSCHTPS